MRRHCRTVVAVGERPDLDELMRPTEAARTLAISRRTLSEWALAGLLPYRETPGGHRRYPRWAVLALADRLDHRHVEIPLEAAGIAEPYDGYRTGDGARAEAISGQATTRGRSRRPLRRSR